MILKGREEEDVREIGGKAKQGNRIEKEYGQKAVSRVDGGKEKEIEGKGKEEMGEKQRGIQVREARDVLLAKGKER